MTTALKSKQEKVLKELRALPSNKRCFDCLQGVPTYANMTVATFVCQTCAGLLRELQHRVKGLSMASFTKEELAALTAGGNERAAQLYRRAAEATPQAGLSGAALKRHMELTYVAKKWFNPAAPSNPAKAAKPVAAAAVVQQAEEDEEDDEDDEEEEEEEEEDRRPVEPKRTVAAKPAVAPVAKSPAAAKPNKQVDLLGDLLGLDDVKTVAHQDPFSLAAVFSNTTTTTSSASPASPAAGFGGGFGFDNSPFGAPAAAPSSPFGGPAASAAPVSGFGGSPFGAPAAAAANPFAAAPAAPVAAPVNANPFLAQLGVPASAPVNPFAAAPAPANPFAAAPAPAAAVNPFAAAAPAPVQAQPFNPFLDAAPAAPSQQQAARDAALARQLHEQEIAAAKQRNAKQEEADRQLAMRLAQGGNDFF